MRISDWSSDVCSSDLLARRLGIDIPDVDLVPIDSIAGLPEGIHRYGATAFAIRRFDRSPDGPVHIEDFAQVFGVYRSEEHTSELQSLMRISYAVFCLQKQRLLIHKTTTPTTTHL